MTKCKTQWIYKVLQLWNSPFPLSHPSKSNQLRRISAGNIANHGLSLSWRCSWLNKVFFFAWNALKIRKLGPQPSLLGTCNTLIKATCNERRKSQPRWCRTTRQPPYLAHFFPFLLALATCISSGITNCKIISMTTLYSARKQASAASKSTKHFSVDERSSNRKSVGHIFTLTALKLKKSYLYLNYR